MHLECDENSKFPMLLFGSSFTPKFIYLLQFIFSLIAFSCVIVLVLNLWAKRIFPLNLKVLMSNLCIALLTANLGNITIIPVVVSHAFQIIYPFQESYYRVCITYRFSFCVLLRHGAIGSLLPP